MLALVFIAAAGIGIAIALSPSLFPSPKAPPPLVGVLLLVIFGVYLVWILYLPYQITLSQDGAVEFISVLKRRSVRAAEIRSIKPEGSKFGFLTVRTDRSKIRILAQFDGFHDFLTRLKALHPGVELKGC
jgi:hypothetical protein